MTVQDFLARFEEQVIRTGRGVMVSCPAHADKTPSLSIHEGQDGRTWCIALLGAPLQRFARRWG